MNRDVTILWRRLDQPGYESARLSIEAAARRLSGTAIFLHNGQPCRLDYLVICDEWWHTRSVNVAGWLGARNIKVDISAGNARWRLNGVECPAVGGCIDIDLNFSPSTNLLPIRRLNPGIGQEVEVRAAWLRFPDFTMEPLSQLYCRTGAWTYRYETGGFSTELEVNEVGFVTCYPQFWEVAAIS